MRLILALTATLALSVVVAVVIEQDPGFIVLGYRNVTIELSLALALALLLIAFSLLYGLIRLLLLLLHLPEAVRTWQRRRRTDQVGRLFTAGLTALVEGQWEAAERSLARAGEAGHMPLMSYLGAAQAADARDRESARDQYLQLARDGTPNNAVTIEIARAEMLSRRRQDALALEGLARLPPPALRHPRVLRLSMELHRRCGDWDALLAFMPTLQRRGVVTAAEAERLAVEVHTRLVQRAAGDRASLLAAWARVPKGLREREPLLVTYVEALHQLGANADAEALIREALPRAWSDPLARWYGRLQGANLAQQLASAEAWLGTRPRNAVLLLTLGRLCRRARLWGKARSYLEASIGFDPQPESYLELGHLLDGIDERDAALQCYRQGLERSILDAAAQPVLPTLALPAPEVSAPPASDAAARPAAVMTPATTAS